MKVLIVGAGTIGSRHIESLFKSDNQYDIYVVEPSSTQLQRLKKILSHYNKGNKIFYFKEIINFFVIFDCVIISTSSNIRRKLFSYLLKTNKFKNILFEKIAFTSLSEYDLTLKEIKKNKIRAFVNFPRSGFNFYKKIKDQLQKRSNISCSVIGSNWGFASNSLHYIELFLYLTESKKLILNSLKIEKISKSKKRKEYIEINGLISLKNQKNDFILLNDFSSKPSISSRLNGAVKIETFEKSFLIYENLGKIIEINNIDLSLKKYKINFPLQSSLTDQFIYKLINENISNLPSLDQCYLSHSLFIKNLSIELVKIDNKYKNNIPIT